MRSRDVFRGRGIFVTSIPNIRSKSFIKTFCGFPWVETSTAGRVYDLCVYYMTGAPEGSSKVFFLWFYGFMEKPGIEPATPGLQGIALIHYTTGAADLAQRHLVHGLSFYI